jgi:hypothetical protein
MNITTCKQQVDWVIDEPWWILNVFGNITIQNNALSAIGLTSLQQSGLG